MYDARSKLEDRYPPFVQLQEKDALLAELSRDEGSEEGEDATKSAFVARLDAARKLGDPITTCWREAENDRRLRLSCARRLIRISRKQLRKKSGSRTHR
jgi:heat shock protein 4